MSMNWSDEYSVGFFEMDVQHKVIFGLINDLDALLAMPDFNSAKARVLLNEITNYASVHFDAEEQVLAERAYADLAAHQKHHDSYVEYVAEQMVNAGADAQVYQDILRYLQNGGWGTFFAKTCATRRWPNTVRSRSRFSAPEGAWCGATRLPV